VVSEYKNQGFELGIFLYSTNKIVIKANLYPCLISGKILPAHHLLWSGATGIDYRGIQVYDDLSRF
jgi:hypothetical protein